MNRVLILFAFILLGTTLKAQTERNPYPKTISVTGSAEMEIVPDEIFVQVDLKEYEKKGQAKMPIDKIKQDFLNKVRSIGIPDSAITVLTYEGNGTEYWEKKKKVNQELLASVSYQIKLKTSDQVDALVKVLDDNATENFAIIKTTHSKIIELRKQLKIQAIKAAKDKANYLAEAINEKIGTAVSINESSDYSVTPYENVFANGRIVDTTGFEEQTVAFRKIKLKFDIHTSFELK